MHGSDKEEFDKIQARGGLQNNYDNFVSGSRSHNYAQYDAEARLQLLEAGYPMSDIPVMAQFYVNMKQLSRKNNLPGGDKSEKIDAECQAMEEVWNSVVKAPTKADTLNLESRKQGIDRLANYTRDLIGRIGNGEFKNTDLNEGRSMVTILKGFETRKEAEPSLNEKIVLAGTANSGAVSRPLMRSESPFVLTRMRSVGSFAFRYAATASRSPSRSVGSP